MYNVKSPARDEAQRLLDRYREADNSGDERWQAEIGDELAEFIAGQFGIDWD